MRPAACQKQSGVGEEYKTRAARIPGVLIRQKKICKSMLLGIRIRELES